VGNEAGVLNRASRAAAGVILGTPSDPADVPTWTLRRVALRRLAKAGVEGDRADRLLNAGPGLGNG
jgi:hypothetical protein